jgi:phosphatidylserine/phosphatidylglycerophosphate/cardiolipin synthase-like enzyme
MRNSTGAGVNYDSFLSRNPFSSFSGVREGQSCQFLIDGESFFPSVHQALTSAKTSICITDWWLYPTLYLLRTPDKRAQEASRLDRVLKGRAEAGVAVRIIL